MNESTQLSRPGVVSTRNEQLTLERNGGDATSHVSYTYDNGDKQGVHLLDYWRIVRKHLWLILGISLVIPSAMLESSSIIGRSVRRRKNQVRYRAFH